MTENDTETGSETTLDVEETAAGPNENALRDAAQAVLHDKDWAGIRTFVANVLAVASALGVVAGVPVVVPGVLWVVALAVLAAECSAIRDWRAPHLMGTRSTCRLILVFAGAVVADRAGYLDVLGWITLISLSVAIVSEPLLRRLNSYMLRGAANLPGAAQPPMTRAPLAAVFPATLAALLFALITAVTGLSWLIALLFTAGALVISGASAIWSSRKLVSSLDDRQVLRDALEQYAPTFALYWRAAAGTDYQISMWLPYLERLGQPFIVIVRTRENFEEAVRLTDRPVVLCRTVEQLDDVVATSLRTIFYVNNAAVNTQMVRYPQLQHIMLNHGDSDKAPSYNPVSRMFDRNFVAGQAAIDRFTNNGVAVWPDQLTIVGRPQIEDIEVATHLPSAVARPNVLYAPTWEGFTTDAQHSSLLAGPALVTRLVQRGCNVIFRPHPYAYRSRDLARACREIIALLAADTTPGAEHVYGERADTEMSLADCFNLSDAMVADVSSVIADYLQSEKPLGIVAVDCVPEEFAASFPLAGVAYVFEAQQHSIVDLDQRLDDLLVHDPARAERKALKPYYLGDPAGANYVELFLAQARKYI